VSECSKEKPWRFSRISQVSILQVYNLVVFFKLKRKRTLLSKVFEPLFVHVSLCRICKAHQIQVVALFQSSSQNSGNTINSNKMLVLQDKQDDVIQLERKIEE
jgi:hypothetical protein